MIESKNTVQIAPVKLDDGNEQFPVWDDAQGLVVESCRWNGLVVLCLPDGSRWAVVADELHVAVTNAGNVCKE